jgi:hypothetical protein
MNLIVAGGVEKVKRFRHFAPTPSWWGHSYPFSEGRVSERVLGNKPAHFHTLGAESAKTRSTDLRLASWAGLLITGAMNH